MKDRDSDRLPDRPSDSEPPAGRSPRVFVSYAHDSEHHKEQVRNFCSFLRSRGVDVELDQWNTGSRRDWYAWVTTQIDDSDFIIVVASHDYRQVGDGNAPSHQNRGVQTETSLLRDRLHGDRARWLPRLLPVVLPGHTIGEIPSFLQPYCADHFLITEFTDDGAEILLRVITGQPLHRHPQLGSAPALPPPSPSGPRPTWSARTLPRWASRRPRVTAAAAVLAAAFTATAVVITVTGDSPSTAQDTGGPTGTRPSTFAPPRESGLACDTGAGSGEILTNSRVLRGTDAVRVNPVLDFGDMHGSAWHRSVDGINYYWGRGGSDNTMPGGVRLRWHPGDGRWRDCDVQITGKENQNIDQGYVFTPAVPTQIGSTKITIQICLRQDNRTHEQCTDEL